MPESIYQARLIKKLRSRFPGCVIIKNDPSYMQGVPDLTIYLGPRWGMLEVKMFANSPIQANQEYYVNMFNRMSFAAFIYPEIEEEVLYDLQLALKPRRSARVPKRQQAQLG